MLSGDQIDAVRLVLDIAQFMGTATAFFAAWWVRKTSANKSAINELNQRVQTIDRDVERLSGQLNNTPTHADIGKVYDRLNEVAQTMSQLTGQLHGLSHQLGMINEYLLNQKGGA